MYVHTTSINLLKQNFESVSIPLQIIWECANAVLP